MLRDELRYVPTLEERVAVAGQAVMQEEPQKQAELPHLQLALALPWSRRHLPRTFGVLLRLLKQPVR